MLVAARDVNGNPIVFATDFPNAPSLVDGKWYAMGCDIAVLPPEAEQFCQGIPPGEKRAIESVSVTYKPEPKSAVEELVAEMSNLGDYYEEDGGLRISPTMTSRIVAALVNVERELERKGGN